MLIAPTALPVPIAAPVQTVPPPPSAEQRLAELASVHELTDHRTAELDAKAISLDERGAWGMWQDEAREYRSHAGTIEGIKGTARMNAAIGAAALRTKQAKGTYLLQRPFQLDPTIVPLGPIPSDSSYPSGHASAAAAAATVLASLWPERRAHYEELLASVQWARVYSGMHFPSDVRAGEALGRAVGMKFVDRD